MVGRRRMMLVGSLVSVLVTLGCSAKKGSSDSPVQGGAGTSVTAGAGAGSSGNGSAGTAVSSAGTSAAGNGASGASGVGAGTSGENTDGSVAADGGGNEPTGDGGPSDSGATHPGIPLVDCVADVSALTKACGTFTTDGGKKIQLGPYGAATDQNVGKGFEVPIQGGDSDNNATCKFFAATFMQPQATTDKLLDTMDLDFALYSVYRPANWVAGETYPLITWGNGTCAQPEGYGALLRYVASYGYVIVAPNSRWTQQNSVMTKALDFMQAANADASSPYYQKLDLTRIGAMGHSQGGMATVAAASDARIKSVIIWNGGDTASKPFLSVSADRDLFNTSVASYTSAVNAAPKAAFLFFHMVPMTGANDGHLVLMLNPERVVEPTRAWWDFMLKGDAASKDWFVGSSCKLCGMTSQFDYGQHGLQ